MNDLVITWLHANRIRFVVTTCKTQNFYILLAFFLITIALLMAVSIYCYLIKCRPKQKHLLPFQFTNCKLKI